MHWRSKWQPTPGFLPRESQGQRSLVGCSIWSRTESDMTEATLSSSSSSIFSTKHQDWFCWNLFLSTHLPQIFSDFPYDNCSATKLCPTLIIWIDYKEWEKHTRLLHPPLFPEVCSNSCPLSPWCQLTISSSATPFSFCFSLTQYDR